MVLPKCTINRLHQDAQAERYAGAQGQPLILESDPLGFTQGTIVASDNTSQMIDMKVMDGYDAPQGGRIQMFDSQGVMLPHAQDPSQNVTDLGTQSFSALLGLHARRPQDPSSAVQHSTESACFRQAAYFWQGIQVHKPEAAMQEEACTGWA